MTGAMRRRVMADMDTRCARGRPPTVRGASSGLALAQQGQGQGRALSERASEGASKDRQVVSSSMHDDQPIQLVSDTYECKAI